MPDTATPMTNEDRESSLLTVEKYARSLSRPSIGILLVPLILILSFFLLDMILPGLLAFVLGMIFSLGAFYSYDAFQIEPDQEADQIADLLAIYSPLDKMAYRMLQKDACRDGKLSDTDLLDWVHKERAALRTEMRDYSPSMQAFLETEHKNQTDKSDNPNRCASCLGIDLPEARSDFASTGMCGMCGRLDEVWDLPHLAHLYVTCNSDCSSKEQSATVNLIRNSHIPDVSEGEASHGTL